MSTETRLRQHDLQEVTADDLDRLLVETESAITRLRHLQTLVIREADLRQLPLGDGCRTLSEWVSGRADVDRSTADALVRIARREHAELDEALATGRAGFDRVSAAAGTEAADLAPHLDIACLRRRAARTERLSRLEEVRRFGRRSFAYQRDLFGATGRFWGEGPALETDAIFSAIESAADELPSPPPGHVEPRSARRFDGLLALALGEGGDQHVHTTVIVDASDAAPSDGESGVWIASGPRVGPGTLERILCESTCEITARTQDGAPLAVGNARSAVSGRIRRWVLAGTAVCARPTAVALSRGSNLITSGTGKSTVTITTTTSPLSAGSITTWSSTDAGSASTRRHRHSDGGSSARAPVERPAVAGQSPASNLDQPPAVRQHQPGRAIAVRALHAFGSNCSHRPTGPSTTFRARSTRSLRHASNWEPRGRGRRDRRALCSPSATRPTPRRLRPTSSVGSPGIPPPDRRPDVVRSPVGRNHALGGDC